MASPSSYPEFVVSISESLLSLPKLTGRATSGDEGAGEKIGICIDEGTYIESKLEL